MVYENIMAEKPMANGRETIEFTKIHNEKDMADHTNANRNPHQRYTAARIYIRRKW